MTTFPMNDLDLNQLQDQIGRLAKNLKSEKDLSDLTQQLVKMTFVENSINMNSRSFLCAK